MKKFIYTLLFLVLLLLGAYIYWMQSDRVTNRDGIFPRYVLGEVEQYGKNTGKGNLVLLSPYLHAYDYSSEEAFNGMLQYYFSLAMRKGMLNDSTIVVLPEYIGTWLVAANEKRSVYTDTSLEKDMRIIALSNPVNFSTAYLSSHSKDKSTEAIFRMKSEVMLKIYQHTFSRLAQEFKVTIVAGSIVLPDPNVKDGKIEINKKGKLYNISAVFDTSGKLHPSLTKKIFPIEEEKTFTASAKESEIPVYSTPAGNLAVLICADAWYPEPYEFLKDKNVKILAVPSFVAAKEAWNKPWAGYNGAATPVDIDKGDIGQLTEKQAWIKYAALRSNWSSIKTSAYVFLRGDLWNMDSDGHTLLLQQGAITEGKEPENKTGSLINVWLE